MLGLNLLRPTTAFASSSRLTLSAPIALNQVQSRFRSDLAPRRTKYRKAQKGRVSIPTVCPLNPFYEIVRTQPDPLGRFNKRNNT